MAEIIAVCTSNCKGEKKANIGEGLLVADHGLAGDAHAGPWHRQVSLLAWESVEKMLQLGLDVTPGSFAENLTTRGIDLVSLPIGSQLKIGPTAIGEVTQIGKECHQRCAIYHQVGQCVMPEEGIFIRIILGGLVKAGDRIEQIERLVE
ncbi:MAG: MOSC domain-containing protein [Bacillota bacterium]